MRVTRVLENDIGSKLVNRSDAQLRHNNTDICRKAAQKRVQTGRAFGPQSKEGRAPNHHKISTKGERLDDVFTIANATVEQQREFGTNSGTDQWQKTDRGGNAV